LCKYFDGNHCRLAISGYGLKALLASMNCNDVKQKYNFTKFIFNKYLPRGK
jgi:hypothetical protein